MRVREYYKYFDKILSYERPNLNEVFLKEFIDDYISSITKFEVWGIEPEKTKIILTQLKDVSELSIAADNSPILKSEIERIEKQLEKMEMILNGKDEDEDEDEACPPDSTSARDKEHKAFFPIIDSQAPEDFYGIIESVTVRINKTVDIDKFIIVPSEKEIEKKILEQCKRSWFVALDLSREYIKKPHKYHEVIISFNKKDGFYEGNSLGTALTISFLEELLKFYNPTYIIKIKEQTAFTGGITEEGNVLPCGEEIIKQKVKAVFFSEMSTFIVPKIDETPAREQLLELQKIYAKRNLKLIPVDDISDVLNRRDVVDIRKQKLVVRTGKFVKKNWLSAVVTVLLAILFGYLYVVDWDDNPAIIESNGFTLLVKNKNGRILWSKKVDLPKDVSWRKRLLDNFCSILDTDGDGKNEVLFTGSLVIEREKFIDQKLICFNFQGDTIWTHSFVDRVESQREVLKPYYNIEIMDTVSLDERKSLYLVSTNSYSFSSAIFRVDPINGERLPGIIWCSGQTVDAMIKDIDNDGRRDILAIGVDNGFEEIVIFAFKIDTLSRVLPSTNDYIIKNFPLVYLKNYIRLPKTDYDNYLHMRMPSILKGSFKDEIRERKYVFATSYEDLETISHLWIKLDYNL